MNLVFMKIPAVVQHPLKIILKIKGFERTKQSLVSKESLGSSNLKSDHSIHISSDKDSKSMSSSLTSLPISQRFRRKLKEEQEKEQTHTFFEWECDMKEFKEGEELTIGQYCFHFSYDLPVGQKLNKTQASDNESSTFLFKFPLKSPFFLTK